MIHEGLLLATSRTSGANHVGTYTLENDVLSDSVTPHKYNEGPFAVTQLSGTVKDGESLKIDFAASYGAKGSMSLAFKDSYKLPSALSTTVGADGKLSGGSSLGCAFQGRLAVVDPARNLYQARLDVSRCGAQDGATRASRPCRTPPPSAPGWRMEMAAFRT